MIWDVDGGLPGIGSVFETFPLDEVFPFVIWAFYNVLHNISRLEDSKTIAFCCPRVLVVTRSTLALPLSSSLPLSPSSLGFSSSLLESGASSSVSLLLPPSSSTH
jgi:hypothetical protein